MTAATLEFGGVCPPLTERLLAKRPAKIMKGDAIHIHFLLMKCRQT
jgi:hypothetical protein